MIRFSGLRRCFAFSVTAMLAVSGVALAAPAQAQDVTYNILHTFTGGAMDGRTPSAGLIQGLDRMLYGTTLGGGNTNDGTPYGFGGTVFKLAPDGSGYTILHRFTAGPTDGIVPYAPLIQGPDGTLYGTTYYGGAAYQDPMNPGGGTVFKLAPDGSGFTLLHSFMGGATDGKYPSAGLTQGPDGTLYGTTDEGGTNFNGTVFKLAPDASGFRLLHSDDGVNGVAYGLDGALYGWSRWGGPNVAGLICRLATDGSDFRILHNFDVSQPHPNSLIQGLDGTLFGTGAEQNGRSSSIFRMAPDGSNYRVLYFNGDIENPNGLVQGPDGTLYGTTRTGGIGLAGVLFLMPPDGGDLWVLYSFGVDSDGVNPTPSLIRGPDGTFYGTTASSRQQCVISSGPCGVVFSFSYSFPSLERADAPPGATSAQHSNHKGWIK